MIVDIPQFNAFTNNFEDSDAAVAMKTTMLKAAQGVVSQYLGYDPEMAERVDTLSGFGFDFIKTTARPIKSVKWVEVNGDDVWDGIRFHDDTISLDGGVFPCGYGNIQVKYVAGYETVPAEIVQTILAIAGLMLQESGGNIGLTGRSFGDQTRSFTNYTDYTKHLRAVDAYRTAIR